MNGWTKTLLVTLVLVAAGWGIDRVDTARQNERFQGVVQNPETRYVGVPIPDGVLQGCIAMEQTFHERDGKFAQNLWVVRCPNSQTSTTWRPGKQGTHTTITN